MSTILEIDGLKIGFRKEDTVREIVHGVVIGLSAGEFLALVGESGSGKTVTAQAVLRLLPETHIAYSSLTALDFLGFGLPPGSSSLGACRTYASRLDFCPFSTETSILLASSEPPSFAFAALHGGFSSLSLSALFGRRVYDSSPLLVFTGEAVRDAFDSGKPP